MLQQSTYAEVVAFYADPLPCETRGRGYGETIIRAKIAALQSLLGETSAIRWNGPRMDTAAMPPAKAAKRVAARKRAMTAEQFFDAFQHARRAVCEAIGERWVVLGHSTWATLPAGWRSFTGPRGGKVRLPKDVRLPPAQYWQGGVLPDGLVFAPPSRGLTPWVVFQPADSDMPAYECDPIMANAALAHREQIAADKPAQLRRYMVTCIKQARRRHSEAVCQLAHWVDVESDFAAQLADNRRDTIREARESVRAAIAEYRAAVREVGA